MEKIVDRCGRSTRVNLAYPPGTSIALNIGQRFSPAFAMSFAEIAVLAIIAAGILMFGASFRWLSLSARFQGPAGGSAGRNQGRCGLARDRGPTRSREWHGIGNQVRVPEDRVPFTAASATACCRRDPPD